MRSDAGTEGFRQAEETWSNIVNAILTVVLTPFSALLLTAATFVACMAVLHGDDRNPWIPTLMFLSITVNLAAMSYLNARFFTANKSRWFTLLGAILIWLEILYEPPHETLKFVLFPSRAWLLI